MFRLGSISAALSCLVYLPREEYSGEERGLITRTAAGNRACVSFQTHLLSFVFAAQYTALSTVNICKYLVKKQDLNTRTLYSMTYP